MVWAEVDPVLRYESGQQFTLVLADDNDGVESTETSRIYPLRQHRRRIVEGGDATVAATFPQWTEKEGVFAINKMTQASTTSGDPWKGREFCLKASLLAGLRAHRPKTPRKSFRNPSGKPYKGACKRLSHAERGK